MVAADPSADRVVGEDPAGVGLLADGMGDLLLERPVVPLHGDVAAPVQVGEDRGERDGLGEGHDPVLIPAQAVALPATLQASTSPQTTETA